MVVMQFTLSESDVKLAGIISQPELVEYKGEIQRCLSQIHLHSTQNNMKVVCMEWSVSKTQNKTYSTVKCLFYQFSKTTLSPYHKDILNHSQNPFWDTQLPHREGMGKPDGFLHYSFWERHCTPVLCRKTLSSISWNKNAGDGPKKFQRHAIISVTDLGQKFYLEINIITQRLYVHYVLICNCTAIQLHEQRCMNTVCGDVRFAHGNMNCTDCRCVSMTSRGWSVLAFTHT